MNDDPPLPSRPDAGLRIDPVRIGRPSVAPIVVGMIAIAFVGAAILKPWQAPPRPVVAVPAASAQATGVARGPRPGPSATPAAGLPDLATMATPIDEWGIRALVSEGPKPDGTSVVGEYWQGLAVPAVAADPEPTLGLEQGLGATGRPVLAVGVTTPRDTLALDVRFWRLDGAAGQRRVLAVPTPGPDAGSWLWLPDPHDATSRHGWPTGDYQIDILAGRRVVHVVTHIESDAPPSPRPKPGEVSVTPLPQALAAFPPGPFAIGPGSIEPVVADPGPPLDAADAWLAATDPGGAPTVGRIVGDPIVGIGVLLEPGETAITAELERVSPARDMPAMRVAVLPGVDAYGSRVGAAVTLEPPVGMAIADGLYHLIVAIRDAGGDAFSRTWTLEVLPGEPPILPGQALVQLRFFDAVLGSGRQDLPAPIVTGADLGGSDGDGTCGGASRIRPTDEVIGLSTDPRDDVRALRLVPIDTIRRVDVPIAFSTGVTPGMTIVALPPGGIAPRQYALIATIGAGSARTERQYTVCVG